MRKPLFLLACMFLTANILCAADTLLVGSADIPLIPGAVKLSQGQPKEGNLRSASYKVEIPLQEAARFYHSFFEANSFTVIGGALADGSYDVSVNKGDTYFALKIFMEKGATKVHFLW